MHLGWKILLPLALVNIVISAGLLVWDPSLQLMMQVAWAWVDSGATLLALPEGRQLLPRRLLMGLEPEHLSPEHGYVFLSNGLAEIEEKKGDD